MKRQEYIDALSRELYGFDDAAREDIVLEIEDHIDELMASKTGASEEEVIAGLEKPESLAASLRAEAGIADEPRQPRRDFEENSRDEEALKREDQGSRRDDSRRGKARITINGEDLEDVLRRAFEIARIFKDKKHDEDMNGSPDESSDDTPFQREMDVENVKLIKVKTRSADVRILLSVDGLSIATPGESSKDVRIRDEGEGSLEISTRTSVRDADLLELKVPSSVDSLEVSTMSGDIQVLDRIGDLAARTASGDVSIKSCSGNVHVTTASGDISLDRCSEGVVAQSASGSISVRLDDQCASASIVSVSGDLDIRYPEDFDANFAWKTLSGEVECDAESSGTRAARSGAGLVPVRVSTTSGDIAIRRA